MKQLLSAPIIRLVLALLLAAFANAALAAPSRIIILRHGEKADSWKLCEIGEQRAKALALNYLGKDADQVAVRRRRGAGLLLRHHPAHDRARLARRWPAGTSR